MSACATSAAQTWTQDLAAPPTGELEVDHEGHILLIGPGQGQSALLENLDEQGHVRWATASGGASALAVAQNGEVLSAGSVAGTTLTDPTVRIGGTPRSQVSVSRLADLGRRVWVATIGDDQGDLGNQFVGEAPDGTIWIAGSFVADMPPPRIPNVYPDPTWYAARLSASGQLIWERHWGRDPTMTGDVGTRGFVVDVMGRLGVIFWVSGQATIDALTLQNVVGRDYSGFLVWFGADGRAVDSIDVTEDGGERFDGVQRDAEGRLYVHGYIDALIGGSERSTPVVTAVTATGERLWSKRFPLGDASAIVDTHLAIDDCGDVLVAVNYGYQSFLASRLGREGDIKAQVSVPLPNSGWVDEVAPAPGGMYVAGASGLNAPRGFLSRLGL
jgi:hypothetical protein